ncbi:MAG: hypothetical protein A4E61_00002 [Syntrophorhabdus sp. PtaB.Bin184]|nr:MAG: hypothetical protein A4E61_00002 [Syntrophorhabdus sp. PtaB.Bin184]
MPSDFKPTSTMTESPVMLITLPFRTLPSCRLFIDVSYRACMSSCEFSFGVPESVSTMVLCPLKVFYASLNDIYDKVGS